MKLTELLQNLKERGVPEKRETSESNGPSIPEFYANSINVNVSFFELELQAFLIDSSQNVKGALHLRVSPQTAWMLARSLAKQIGEYERLYGKMEVPDAIQKSLDQ